jgi:hypothetical protein
LPARVTLSTDASPVLAVTDIVAGLLAGATDGTRETVERLFGLPDFAAELVRVEMNPRAATANKAVVMLYPGDGLLRLMAALRAREGEGLVAEHLGCLLHDFSQPEDSNPAGAESSVTLPAIGEPFGGGYFAGAYLENGVPHALIVAPKAGGEAEALKWGADGETSARSPTDGLANSDAINDDSHPAARFCRALTIGGFTDWHLPALNQMSVLRDNLTPENDHVPVQTTAEAFKEGGPEAFETDDVYWTSTERSAGYAWSQHVYYGTQGDNLKGWRCRVRAVRKCPL